MPTIPAGYQLRDTGFLWLKLHIPELYILPKELAVEGFHLFLKSEFHVTVINTRKVAGEIAKNQNDINEIQKNLPTLLSESIAINPIAFAARLP